MYFNKKFVSNTDRNAVMPANSAKLIQGRKSLITSNTQSNWLAPAAPITSGERGMRSSLDPEVTRTTVSWNMAGR